MRALVLLVLAGCGDDAVTATEPDARLLTATEAWEQNLADECARAFECRSSYDGSVGVFDEYYGVEESDCVARLLGRLGYVGPSVEEGRVLFNPLAAQDCLDDGTILDVSCAEFWARTYFIPLSCETQFIGTVPDGGACTFFLDCAEVGSTCSNLVCVP